MSKKEAIKMPEPESIVIPKVDNEIKSKRRQRRNEKSF